ncbi:MAG: DedA family protein [Blastocatellales bacterium]
MEQLIVWLQELPPAGVLALMFAIAYIENVFPPSPSDVALVFTGTLIGLGTVDFIPALFFASLGGTLGFMTAYWLGRYFDRHFIETRFGRYLPLGALEQVESLFRRYGYGVIIANRFLAGTRAIVSFFAGMSRMNLAVTTLLCAISATAWNAMLLYLGKIFASNWRTVAHYLEVYSTVATIFILSAIGITLAVYFYRRRNRKDTAKE